VSEADFCYGLCWFNYSLMRCQRWMDGYSFSRGHRGSNRPL